MKSKIHKLADYHEAPIKKHVKIKCPKSYIEKEFRHLTRPYKRTEASACIENGDAVVLALESSMKKYNRPGVPLTVGSGLFDSELEAQLCGRHTGEIFTAVVQGEDVKVTVLHAHRTIFPEPTDAMVIAYAQTHEAVGDIDTVAAYRQYIIEKYMAEEKQNILYDTVNQIIEYVLRYSDWDFDEDELTARTADIRADLEESLAAEGKTLAAMSEEELEEELGLESFEALAAECRCFAEREIAADLWLMAEHGQTSVDAIEGNPWGFLDAFVQDYLMIEEEV